MLGWWKERKAAAATARRYQAYREQRRVVVGSILPAVDKAFEWDLSRQKNRHVREYERQLDNMGDLAFWESRTMELWDTVREMRGETPPEPGHWFAGSLAATSLLTPCIDAKVFAESYATQGFGVAHPHLLGALRALDIEGVHVGETGPTLEAALADELTLRFVDWRRAVLCEAEAIGRQRMTEWGPWTLKGFTENLGVVESWKALIANSGEDLQPLSLLPLGQ